MAGIETYGGSCPKCLHGMMQKHDTSMEAFQFDACPWCGFAYGAAMGEEYKTDDVWESIFLHFQVKSREELISKLKLDKFTSKDEMELYPSIYNYGKDDGITWAYTLIQKHGYLVDLDVKVNGKEGTIKEFQDGKLYVLWDKDKDKESPTYEEFDIQLIGPEFQIVEKIES